MSALSIQPPYPAFAGTDGQPLENGYIWIGVVNLNPQVNPITVYWDAALTILAAQPIRTLNGYPSRSGTPARLYVNSDYSIQVLDSKGSLVYSAPEATERISSDLISFTQYGSGAVTRTVQDKLEETVSVTDFGGTSPVIAQIDGVVGYTENSSIEFSGYHSANDGGGGLFYWDNTKSKADHNGGTIIDPTAPFPSNWDNQTQLAAWFDSNNAGTGCWIRQFAGAVNVKWFGAYADASKTSSNVLAFQRTFDFAYGNVLVPDANIYEVELGEGNFWINGPVGFPTSNLQGRGFMVLKGRGGIITVAEDEVGIGEGIFTSLRSIPTPDSTDDLFTGNIVIDDILFVGDIATGGKPVVFNGDRLYNIEIKSCKFYEIYMVARSFRNKGAGFAQGYFQSLYIHHCHFARCGFVGVDEGGGILHGFSSYNVRVLENFGEGSLGYFVHLNGGASRSFSMFNNIWESGGMILDATNIEGQLVGTYSEANIGASVTASKAFVRLQEIAANTRPNNFVLEANNFYLSDAQTSDSDFYPIKVAGSPITGNHHKIRVLSNSISSPAPQTKGLVQTLNGRIAEYIGNSVGQVGDNNTVFSIKNFSFEKTTVISLTGSSTTTLRFTFQGAGSFKIRVSAVTGYAASGAVFEFNVFGQFTSTPLIDTAYSTSVPASGTGAVTLGSITGGVGYLDIPFITTGGDDRRAFVEITGAGSSSILTTGAAFDFTGNPDIANVVRL